MQITGRYKEDNHPPMVFKLAGRTCETYVSGKPGAPSQPVEHLSDDTTRLGPVPSTKVPAPGLSTGPGGVIVPVPVKTAAAPGASTSAPAVVFQGGPTPSASLSEGAPPNAPGGTIGGGSSTPTPTSSASLGPEPTFTFTTPPDNPNE
jgi:serine/threonine-protein kinase